MARGMRGIVSVEYHACNFIRWVLYFVILKCKLVIIFFKCCLHLYGSWVSLCLLCITLLKHPKMCWKCVHCTCTTTGRKSSCPNLFCKELGNLTPGSYSSGWWRCYGRDFIFNRVLVEAIFAHGVIISLLSINWEVQCVISWVAKWLHE